MRGEAFFPSDWDERRSVLGDDGLGVDVARNLAVFRKRAPAGPRRVEELAVALNFSDAERSVAFRVPADGSWVDLISGARFDAVGGMLACGIPASDGRVLAKRIRA
jgi:hypothetical protein